MIKTYYIEAKYVVMSEVVKRVKVRAESEEEAKTFANNSWYEEDKVLSRRKLKETSSGIAKVVKTVE